MKILEEREKDYGDFGEFADKLQRLKDVLEYKSNNTARQLSIDMVLMKLVRLSNSPNHKDSFVDIAGYAELGVRTFIKEAEWK